MCAGLFKRMEKSESLWKKGESMEYSENVLGFITTVEGTGKAMVWCSVSLPGCCCTSGVNCE